MILDEAKQQLRCKKKMARESWPLGFWVEAVELDPNHRLRLIDNCGRDYGISAADEVATDWIIYEE